MANMRDMWREATPSGAIADFLTVFRQAGGNRWYLVAAAALTTVGVFSVMAGESWKRPRPMPQIEYITSWPADRTDAETAEFIAANQRAKDARQAEIDKLDAETRELYKALGRVSGMDVDTIDQQGAKDRAAAEAAEKAKAEAILKANGAE